MALTITETFRWTQGGKQFRCYDIVHDTSTTLSFSAASMDLVQIEAIINHGAYVSMQAIGSVVIRQMHVSIDTGGVTIEWMGSDVGKSYLTVAGW